VTEGWRPGCSGRQFLPKGTGFPISDKAETGFLFLDPAVFSTRIPAFAGMTAEDDSRLILHPAA